jgi:hypothetical protein
MVWKVAVHHQVGPDANGALWDGPDTAGSHREAPELQRSRPGVSGCLARWPRPRTTILAGLRIFSDLDTRRS